MRALALRGAVRGKKVVTTLQDPGGARRQAISRAGLHRAGPDRRWAAHFTYVATWSGPCTPGIADVYSRAIVGWCASTNKRTRFVLDALQMRCGGATATGGRSRRARTSLRRGFAVHVFRVHHAPADAGPDASIGTSGTHSTMP